MSTSKSQGLFGQSIHVGTFHGFVGSGNSFEFHADLKLPYKPEFQSIPMHGQYLLVQLSSPQEAILGRIVSLSSEGTDLKMDYEEWVSYQDDQEALLQASLRKLKYRVNMHVLGVLREGDHHHITFVPSHRRLPPQGSCVAFPSARVLREIAGHNIAGAAIGHLALGEYIYAKEADRVKREPGMRFIEPDVLIRFPIESLIARRSFIFARAGFGKSNLNKLLFSELYQQTPTVVKRGGRQVPVGTLLFDPDGEYFWPDDKGRPGLCDIPALQDKLVVFTPREAPSAFYQSFVAGGIKLDIRELPPADILSLALCAQKQDQQNVQKLKGLSMRSWRTLVNVIEESGNQASLSRICRLLHLDKKQEAEAMAARSNMTTVVQTLHQRGSALISLLTEALRQGKLCILDVSQLHDEQSLILSGILMRHFFQLNQEEFTKADSQSIPIIAVIEEAQSVLTERSPAAEPHRAWVKEGRKYDLGALLITQQPGSLSPEILSQGDNWFVLHLPATTDLKTLQRANAYFSQDLLCMLLNEPIPGQAVFWSSVGGKPYPISLRVLSFEHHYHRLDEAYTLPAAPTFVGRLVAEVQKQASSKSQEEEEEEEQSDEEEEEADSEALFVRREKSVLPGGWLQVSAER